MSFKLRAIQPKEFVGDEALTITTADSRYAKKTDLVTIENTLSSKADKSTLNNYVDLSSNQTVDGQKTFRKTTTFDSAIKVPAVEIKGFQLLRNLDTMDLAYAGDVLAKQNWVASKYQPKINELLVDFGANAQWIATSKISDYSFVWRVWIKNVPGDWWNFDSMKVYNDSTDDVSVNVCFQWVSARNRFEAIIISQSNNKGDRYNEVVKGIKVLLTKR